MDWIVIELCLYAQASSCHTYICTFNAASLVNWFILLLQDFAVKCSRCIFCNNITSKFIDRKEMPIAIGYLTNFFLLF